MNGPERRRLARIALRCDVVVRERASEFAAETSDVGARGCRLRSEHPIARGALLRLRFGGDGDAPLDAVGQVAWTRRGEPLEVGVAFVTAPPSCATWIDAIAVAHLCARGDEGGAEPAASVSEALLRLATSRLGVGDLSDAVLRLGTAPEGALPAAELAVARVAAREGTVAEAVAGADGLAAAVALLRRGAVTLGRAVRDAAGWRRVLATPPVLVPPPPPEALAAEDRGLAPGRGAGVAALIAETLSDGGTKR